MKNTPTNVDVLISGYGPTGATLAILLGQLGHRVLVIDQANEIYDKPRAITADHEIYRILQACGVADEIAQTAMPHPGTDYVGLQGQVIKRFYPSPPPNILGWEPSWMFVQPELEATLRRRVAQLPQVQCLPGHQLTRVEASDSHVTAHMVRLADDTPISVQACYLIAADGASSLVRKQLAAPIEDLAFDEWWIVVDAWINGPIQLPERCVQYCQPARPRTYIVGPDTLRRWEIKLLPHERPEDFRDNHDAAWQLLGQFVDTRALKHWRTAVYRFHALVVQDWRKGRVFLAGDAAHQMPPFLGQGLCAGLRDASNLAWKLDLALRGLANEHLLDTYTQERKRHVRTVVGHAKSFGLIIGELDVERARERDRVLGDELRSGKAETIRQRFIPGLEEGLIANTPFCNTQSGSGELFIQPWVRQGTQPWSRLDDLTGAPFVLAATSASVLAGLDEASLTLWRAIGGHTVVIQTEEAPASATTTTPVLQEKDGLLTQWLKRHHAVAVIARPDKYVYGVAHHAQELGQLIQTLALELGRA